MDELPERRRSYNEEAHSHNAEKSYNEEARARDNEKESPMSVLCR